MAALQLLAETKTRMQRSGHGRALAELAIVRLTLLEATIDLATLVNELCSTPAPRAELKTPPGGSIPRQTSVVRSLPTPAEPAPEATPADVARVRLPLETGHEMDFWSQLVLELPVRDLVRDATAKVSNAAIIGPNHLEILFPSAYHVCKALCEQSPTLERLGKLAGELAGRPVRITCRLDSTPVKPLAQPAKPVATRGPGNDRQPSPETNDPYAEKARSIFGGTIVRVEAVSTPKQDPEAVEE
jgi:DNA polymerase-3 subunit gamma/tau